GPHRAAARPHPLAGLAERGRARLARPLRPRRRRDHPAARPAPGHRRRSAERAVMAPIKILVVAEPYERDGIRAAASAAGGVSVGAEAHDDLAQVVASVRADAVVLAG